VSQYYEPIIAKKNNTSLEITQQHILIDWIIAFDLLYLLIYLLYLS